MKYGMNLQMMTTFVTEEHRPTLELLAQMGYDVVEVPIYRLEEDHYTEVGEWLDELGLERTGVTAHGAEASPIDPDPDIRAKGVANTKRAIDWCVAMGAPKLVGPLFSAFGAFSGSQPTQEERQRAVEAVQEMAAYAEQHGVELSLEYLNRFEMYLLNTTGDTARFVRDVGAPNVGVLYDTFHANIEEKDSVAAIRDNAEWINHVHISENDRSTPGSGQVRWDETFDVLAEVGYADMLVVEAFGLGLPELIPVVKIWRRMFESEEQLSRDALAFMRREWAKREEAA